jgi:hypothetical protein
MRDRDEKRVFHTSCSPIRESVLDVFVNVWIGVLHGGLFRYFQNRDEQAFNDSCGLPGLS